MYGKARFSHLPVHDQDPPLHSPRLLVVLAGGGADHVVHDLCKKRERKNIDVKKISTFIKVEDFNLSIVLCNSSSENSVEHFSVQKMFTARL